ncbi:MAG: hypothetical protein HZA77_02040 [Candidatus Schekmanbacteria bacterium]|nr:hypothetical protein [Candidatus Schekmanbacteria bacterium]
MTFFEEIESLSNISMILLQKLEHETVYVKEFIEKECEKIQEKGWLEQKGDEPWLKTFKRNNYVLKVAFIHARKGEHITGADLVFELKNKKIVFVQSKKVGSGGRIHFNRFQLQKLIELEAKIYGLLPLNSFRDINETKRIPPYLLLACLTSCYPPLKATFYHIIMKETEQIEERFFHSSEVLFTIASNKSVHQKEFLNNGLKPDEFQKMFWECKIGGPDITENLKKDVLHLYSLYTNRFIIWLDITVK